MVFLSQLNPAWTPLTLTSMWLSLECCSFQFNKNFLSLILWHYVYEMCFLFLMTAFNCSLPLCSPFSYFLKTKAKKLTQSGLIFELVLKKHFSQSLGTLFCSQAELSPWQSMLHLHVSKEGFEGYLMILCITMFHSETVSFLLSITKFL